MAARCDSAHIIHLEGASDREQYIKKIMNQSWLAVTPEVFRASDGGEWMRNPDIPKKQRDGWATSRGQLGCLHSHITILESIQSNIQSVIFEDDCDIHSDNIADFIKSVPDDWDVLLLGANEYVDSSQHETYAKVARFWGTHAMILRRRAVEAVLKVWSEAKAEGFFYPADWLWNETLRKERLVCYGPIQPRELVRQAIGIKSSITGIVRK